MPYIPTKSSACMSMSWLLGNVYTAMSCMDEKSNKFNAYNFKKGITAQEYRNTVEDLLQTLPNPENQHMEAAWKNIKQAVCKAAGNILGHSIKKVRNGWCDEECKEILKAQNKARLKMLQRKTRSNTEAYKEACREARKVCRGRKNTTKKTCWKNYKRNTKEML
ncbi:hypothetical protein Cfor_03829 [Coptotermes formosanus]|uniref:Uncharacterized protein n=1 Tax=Coptotermes formosanus TaxID=36987 RepID=A0A6L2Q017_COPFO|nr:hypothetical protein Cfor_03829 [Coptotermes formosanus]